MPAVLGINTWGVKVKNHIHPQTLTFLEQVLSLLLTLGPFPRCSEHGSLRRIEGRVFEWQIDRREFLTVASKSRARPKEVL